MAAACSGGSSWGRCSHRCIAPLQDFAVDKQLFDPSSQASKFWGGGSSSEEEEDEVDATSEEEEASSSSSSESDRPKKGGASRWGGVFWFGLPANGKAACTWLSKQGGGLGSTSQRTSSRSVTIVYYFYTRPPQACWQVGKKCWHCRTSHIGILAQVLGRFV